MGDVMSKMSKTVRRFPAYLPSGLHTEEIADEIERLESSRHEYRATITRLEKQRNAYQLKAKLVEDRYLPCPDHRDKLTTDECMMCQIERLTNRLL